MTLYIDYHIDPTSVEIKTIKGKSCDSYRIGNTHIRMEAGQPVLSIQDGRWKQPPVDLNGKIDRVSIKSAGYDYQIDRVAGLYRLDDAEAFVDRIGHTQHHGAGVMIEVTAPTKESALALWDAIHRGDIRPHDEMDRKQMPPLIDDDTMAEAREQASRLARQLLKTEMARLVSTA